MVSRKISCFRHNTSLSLLSRVLPVDAHAIQARAAHATATRRRRPVNDSIDLDSYSEEAQLKFIRRAQIVGQNQGIDIWAHPVDTLGARYLKFPSMSSEIMCNTDVAIPYATAPWSRSKFSTVKERLSQWLSNQKNKGKSLFRYAQICFESYKSNIAISSMMRLVSYDSLPGIDTQSMGFMGALRMPLHLCTSSSTKPTSWIAPLRKILLENYVSVQQALAKFVS